MESHDISVDWSLLGLGRVASLVQYSYQFWFVCMIFHDIDIESFGKSWALLHLKFYGISFGDIH